jgi:KUP system potassium uptake protein
MTAGRQGAQATEEPRGLGGARGDDPNAPQPGPRPEDEAGEDHAPQGALVPLALGALGVVYGDIGTSPLYALRECFLGGHPIPINPANVLGVLSLIFWALTIVIWCKYLVFVMRADNRGEGGILALLSLVKAGEVDRTARATRFALLLLGLFGASLLFGEGVLTPAISVLSAVEGLGIATHALDPYVVPITIVILVALFSVQRNGTAGIAAVFGPLMLVWFVTLGIAGTARILAEHPDHASVFNAINPLYGVRFLWEHGFAGFLVLGSVVLVITGCEALYADMGHFGARPIRWAWGVIVFPALLLNYFGQGVLLLERGGSLRNPFFELVPEWGLIPLVVLAMLATIIASQALISGAFSLTQQAVQLGYVPRFTIVHTSETAQGQIFVPAVNRALMVLCVAVVITFEESAELANAYGLAVTGTMSITTLLLYAVARERWGWSKPLAAALVAPLLVVDLSFLGPNLLKIASGGWFPLVVGGVVFAAMTTWKRGRAELGRALAQGRVPLGLFLSDLEQTCPTRVSGTAVVMTSSADGIPPVLLHHFKHNKVLHERVVLLSIVTARQPEVRGSERVELEELGHGFYRVLARFGFLETPNVPLILQLCRRRGLDFKIDETTFFLGRETLLATGRSGMAPWRKKVFAFLSRNAPTATAYFSIPPNRVIELGAQVEI